MRLLHIGDVHLGAEARSAERAGDYGAALGTAISAALEHSVDAVLLSGRLFHAATPRPETVAEALQRFRALARAGIPVFAPAASRWLQVLAAESRLRVLSARSEPAFAQVAGVTVIATPPLAYPFDREAIASIEEHLDGSHPAILVTRWLGPPPRDDDESAWRLGQNLRYAAAGGSARPWEWPVIDPVFVNPGALEPPRPEAQPAEHPGGCWLIDDDGIERQRTFILTAQRPVVRIRPEAYDAISPEAAMRAVADSAEAVVAPREGSVIAVLDLSVLPRAMARRLDPERLKSVVGGALGVSVLSLRLIGLTSEPTGGDGDDFQPLADPAQVTRRVLEDLSGELPTGQLDHRRTAQLQDGVIELLERWHETRDADPAAQASDVIGGLEKLLGEVDDPAMPGAANEDDRSCG